MAVMNRVRVVWTGVPGTPWYSNLYTLNSAVTPAQAKARTQTLIEGLRAYVTSAVTARIEGDVSQIESTTGQTIGVTSTPFVDIVGQSSTNRLPAATQLVTQLLTGQFLNGRQVRGRFYLGGLTIGSTDSTGRPLATALTAIDGFWSTYVQANVTGAVVWSRSTGQAVPISFVNTWEQFGQQRSRRD